MPDICIIPSAAYTIDVEVDYVFWRIVIGDIKPIILLTMSKKHIKNLAQVLLARGEGYCRKLIEAYAPYRKIKIEDLIKVDARPNYNTIFFDGKHNCAVWSGKIPVVKIPDDAPMLPLSPAPFAQPDPFPKKRGDTLKELAARDSNISINE